MNTIVPPGRAPTIFDAFAAMEAEENRKDPGRPARLAQQRHRQAMADEAEREAIIARYGGEDVAVAGPEIERLLAAAVEPLCRKVAKRYGNGVFEIETLDGWTGAEFGLEKVPGRVRKAVEQAVPLPTTIASAETEYRQWRARDRELQLLYRDGGADTYLPLACQLRQDIVCALLEHGLRAETLDDAVVRARYSVENVQGGGESLDAAVLADLEYLQTKLGSVP